MVKILNAYWINSYFKLRKSKAIISVLDFSILFRLRSRMDIAMHWQVVSFNLVTIIPILHLRLARLNFLNTLALVINSVFFINLSVLLRSAESRFRKKFIMFFSKFQIFTVMINSIRKNALGIVSGAFLYSSIIYCKSVDSL